MPYANAEAMTKHLAEIGKAVALARMGQSSSMARAGMTVLISLFRTASP
jgi:hypothetical protein